MTKYIILGAGGFGRELREYLEDCLLKGGLKGEFSGYLDDTLSKETLTKNGDMILGGFDENLPISEFKFLIGLGDPKSRSKVFNIYKNKGAFFETLIHPSAYKSASAEVCEGGILCPFSFLGSGAYVGQNCLLNIYSSVGHDSCLGSHSVLSPYATVNGDAILQDEIFLGTKAVITKNCKVGDEVKVSAGSVVYSDLPSRTMAFGNPARMKKNT
ncbi:hypothetical protein [Kiloniella sp.]|uniref:PglD-related sugar-binding protein n=1 Tax=Kiloniella sp. TaxID=1938587 RepID=UPI003A8E3380